MKRVEQHQFGYTTEFYLLILSWRMTLLARSAIRMSTECGVPETGVGSTLASITRTPATPRNRNWLSTGLVGCWPIAQVPPG